MANEEVWVRWNTNERSFGRGGSVRPRREEQKFASRKEAAIFVMETLEESRRHDAEMAVDGIIFGIAGIEQIYMYRKSGANRKARNRPRSAFSPS